MNKIQLNKKFNTNHYNPEGSLLKQLLWYFISAFLFRSGIIPFSSVLVFILRTFGAKIGKDVRIKPYINVKYPWKLIVGDHTWIGEHCAIENLALVSLGKNVCLSQYSMLLTGNHNYKKTTFDLIISPIIIEEGVWIGAKAVVCPGVRACSHAMLTVGSIITNNMEPYSIYSGNPAIKIRNREVAV
ncbi:MAG: putative colanic acid biosynthesis acetyltransferase WcaF [Sphingobacteriales bacterium]|nr:putative colanic acid biosynthesis acetyltransferase WcaF [Sphingobacteriales bacterium]